MGFETLLGVGGSVVGGLLGGKKGPSSSTTTTQNQLDPRAQAQIWGNGDWDSGLLSQYRELLNQPRSHGANSFADTNSRYLISNGAGDMDAARQAAYRAMQGNSAPMTQAAQAGGAQAGGAQAATAQIANPAWAVGSDVKAPNQNNIDLTGSYQNLLSGGNTNALMASLQAGNALTSAQQQQNQANMTDNLTRNVLPSIRGGAIAAGQYGGSRQGTAEGNALSDFTKQLNQSNTQIGLANSANTAAALAGAYESGQNRALSATQGLGAQQYGVASQNAATRNQAEFMNVGSHNDILKTNAGMAQQNNQFNAGLGQANNQFNANLGQNNSQFNVGLQQQAGLANQQSQLSTNAQNSSNNLAGAGLLSGLLGNASNQVNFNDAWKLNQAQGVNSLLAPYLLAGSTQANTQPVYQNRAAGALGGALAGGQLGGLFGDGGLASLFGPGLIGR